MRFRLAHHYGQGYDHGDLFLDTGEERIPTYELSPVHLKELQSMPQFPAAHFFLADEKHPGAWPVIRKEDHRRIYLHYTGEVSGGRGSVNTVLIGEVNFTFLYDSLPEKLWFGVQGSSHGK